MHGHVYLGMCTDNLFIVHIYSSIMLWRLRVQLSKELWSMSMLLRSLSNHNLWGLRWGWYELGDTRH